MSDRSELADTPYAERFKAAFALTEKRTMYLGSEMSQALNGLNLLIAECADKIKQNQPKKTGAVTLHFTACSREEACNGCPHPIWLNWFNPTNGVNPDKWAAKKISQPRRYLPKNATPDLREAVDEALKLIETRKKFIESVRSISRSITWIEKKYPDIFREDCEAGK